MKNYIWRYGIYGALLMVALFALSFLLGWTKLSYQTQEAIGYLSIFLAMGFIVWGIKDYRDRELGGQISFGQAFRLGALIALIPSAGLFLFTLVFFMAQGDKWIAYAMENMPPEQRAQFDANPGLFSNPFFQGMVMFLTAYLIGLLFSALAGLALRRKAPAL